MRKIPFVTGEYYHIYNRGVEKREIFIEEYDYLRFLLEMKEMNTNNSEKNWARRPMTKLSKAEPCSNAEGLIDLVCYCLLPNHFHLILRQRVDGGISRFMHKVSTGYAMYFNLKHKHSGVVFQGTFKGKHINTNVYLLHLSRYVHLNPIDLLVKDCSNEILCNYILSYKWSSMQFYLQDSKRSLLDLDKKIIAGQFSNFHEYVDFVISYAKANLKQLQTDQDSIEQD